MARLSTRLMGGSTQLNGTTSTIPTTLTDNTAFTSGFVLHGWIYPMGWGGGNFGRIFDKTDVQLVLNLSDTQLQTLRFTSTGGGLGGVNTANFSIRLRSWQHVIAHVSANALVTLYINGVVSGTPTSTGALSNITSSNALVLGNRLAADRAFSGNVAELGIISLAGRGNLTAQEIENLYLHGARPAGAVHFWELDESPSTYEDSIGGNTGTGTSTTYSSNVPFNSRTTATSRALATNRLAVRDMGTALRFSSGNYVNRSNVGTLSTTSLSFAVTFLVSNVGSSFPHIIEVGGNDAACFFFTPATRILVIKFANIGGSGISVNLPALSVGSWYSIVGVYDGQFVRAYINGVLASSTSRTGAIVYTDASTFVAAGGAGSTPSGNYMIGIVESAQVWNRALTAQEVSDMYFYNVRPTNDLVYQWFFNEGSGTTALDSSGNANNGTITGATYTTDVPLKPRINT